MNIIAHDDLHPYAAAPLRHLAANTDIPGEGTLHITWNSLRLDLGMPHEFFLGPDPVLCMETPLFGRHLWQFDGSQDPECTYYRVALWDPSVLYGGFRIEANRRRRVRMFETLGLEVQPFRVRGVTAPVLYCLQVPGDTSRKGVDVFTAAIWDLYELKRRTRRPVIVIDHPDCLRETWANERMRKHHDTYANLVRVAHLLGYEMSAPGSRTADYLDRAHCVVGYTTGTTTEALLAGVPCITLHRGSFAAPICQHHLEHVDWPYTGDREGWWDRLAYIQFSWAEIARGEHLETLERILK